MAPPPAKMAVSVYYTFLVRSAATAVETKAPFLSGAEMVVICGNVGATGCGVGFTAGTTFGTTGSGVGGGGGGGVYALQYCLYSNPVIPPLFREG